MTETPFDVAFDYDGVLTDAGAVEVGKDREGVHIDMRPVHVALAQGLTVAVMTCNVVSYVADKLEQHGIRTLSDPWMRFKCPPDGWSQDHVLVTNRKVFARLYVDDNAVRWRCGDPIEALTAMWART